MNCIDILVPNLPESVTDATVVVWHKKQGDCVQRDEILVEIETEKVILEISANETGILEVLLEKEGAIVTSCQVLGRLRKIDSTKENDITEDFKNQKKNASESEIYIIDQSNKNKNILDHNISNISIEPDSSLKNIQNNIISEGIKQESVKRSVHDYWEINLKKETIERNNLPFKNNNRNEKRVPMTYLRKRMAKRLLEAKNNTAMLTTFNEVNMQPVLNLRKKYGELFKKRHGIRLGIMSFYVKAVLESLKRFPEINAYIDGNDIVYRNYFDINIAISTPRGLVTPILKNIDTLSIEDIEKNIKELSIKGHSGKLKLEELAGGNFTITNSGIFGSLMSTPIINPPQSAILGMHAIKDRPMAVGKRVVILPMMYLALSYDHRLIDGKESISFLITVKEILEDPARLLLDI